MNKEEIKSKIQKKEQEISDIKYIISEKMKKGETDLNAMFHTINTLNEEIRELHAQLSYMHYEGSDDSSENIAKEMSILHTSFAIRPNSNQDDPTKYYAPARKDFKTLKEEYKAAESETKEMSEGEVRLQNIKEIEGRIKADYEKRFKEFEKKFAKA